MDELYVLWSSGEDSHRTNEVEANRESKAQVGDSIP